jgi:TetR/AcrR family transcriptional regulator
VFGRLKRREDGGSCSSSPTLAVSRRPARQPPVTRPLAHIVSAIMFLSMAATINIARSVDEILEDIRSQARVLLSH